MPRIPRINTRFLTCVVTRPIAKVDPSDPSPFFPGVRIVINSDTTLMIASHSHVGFASFAGRPIAANATVSCECKMYIGTTPHSPVPLKHGE